jgi:hypothetical protein
LINYASPSKFKGRASFTLKCEQLILDKRGGRHRVEINQISFKFFAIMKKLALTIVCTLAVNDAVFADGIVNWLSITPAAMTAQTNSTQFSPIFGGGSSGGGTIGNTASAGGSPTFYFELLYNTNFTGSQVAAPTFSQLFSGSWLDTGLTATNTTAAGSAGKLAPIAGNAAATVPWAHGVTNNIMLVGWSANLGTSWATVSNELATDSFYSVYFSSSYAFFGESATGYINPFDGPGPGPGANIFGTAANITGLPINSLNTQLYLLPIPEPGTITLAGLGGLSLLLLRRRRRP